ncbi:hypothetical protein QCD60_15645 [Pokkaliibacter sp. MBI-7]|uniref:hypothetical protein n=1 Tax=Pokkaliibacter sp. MBI-7 TaxID=3040600 RepID=UPI002447CBBE|nr:hypothetical protein [Pokkaliibacter sp. MBI-7]MDH2434000.1 hypothetical protein [Pokkaliibacter sp. MBI-7]
MEYVKEEVENAFRLIGAEAIPLSDDQIRDYLDFHNKNLMSYKIEKIYSPNFWQELSNLPVVGKSSLIACDVRFHGWLFDSATDIKRVISECVGFPFYVVQPEMKYSMYFDDHDCVEIHYDDDLFKDIILSYR